MRILRLVIFSVSKYLTLCLLLWLVLINVHAIEPIEDQRNIYLEAGKVLRDGDLDEYHNFSKSLLDYPLYPYLVYEYMRRRLGSLNTEEVRDYLNTYTDVPVTNDLRKFWLKLLAQGGRWEDYLLDYTPQSDTVLQCYQLRAKINTGAQENLLEDIRSVWLVGKSQPDECDPAFTLLYESDLMTQDLILERIRLAMHNGQTKLVSYLLRQLDKSDRELVNTWISIYRNPSRITRSGLEDNELSREILTHGMRRFAAADIDNAITKWTSIKSGYDFTPQQIHDIQRSLAIWSVIRKHPDYRELLSAEDEFDRDSKMFEWRLRAALENQDWQSLVRWTESTPPDDSGRLRWMYWRARALEKTGDADESDELFSQLANERDYYGFLAADRIMADYNIKHIPLRDDETTWDQISAMDSVIRARELFVVGQHYFARREWNRTVDDMSNDELQIAAMIAADWGWHDRTILTLSWADSFDDLVLRFPIVYENEIEKYSNMRELDLGWVFALTRAESAFMSDARSPSGALGLMQVMPATGRETARSIKFRSFSNGSLLDPEKNITIGTAYLKKVYDRFSNKILATAAYNAGPRAVSKWLPSDECVDPDIWVETIPFAETRKYVSRIMFYATLYDWRLANKVSRINERMSIISPEQPTAVADLSCPMTTNSISGL
jgi:soluble lytic murein transglycosylase